MSELSGGTVYVEVNPQFKGFREALKVGVKTASVGADTVEVKVDVDRSSLSRAGRAIDSLSGKVGRFTLASAKSAGKITSIAFAAGIATQGVARLGAALAPATGALVALPAIIGSVAAATGTLKLGLIGVSDALKAGLTGDTEKYAAAMEKLAPAAQATVRQVIALKPAFEKLRKSVQQELFTGIAGQLKLLSGVYMPSLQQRLPKIAASMSVFAENFTRAAANGPLLKGTNAILDNTARGLAHANDNVGGMTNAFGNLAIVGAPVIDRLGQSVGTLSGQFADFINTAAADGRLQAFLDTALSTLKTLGTLLGNVLSILGSVFSAANTAGGSLLNTLAALTGRVAAFLKSAQGVKALNAVFGAMAAVGRSLGVALGAVLPAVAQAFLAIAPVVPPLASALARVVVAVTPLVPIFGELVAVLATGLTAALVALTPYLERVIGFIADHREGVKLFALAILGAAAAFKIYQASVVAISAVTKAWAAVQWILNSALFANPIGIVILALVGLGAALVIAWKKSDTFRAIVQAAWRGIQVAAGATWGFLQKVFAWLQPALSLAGAYFRTWWSVVKTVWSAIKLAFRVGWALVQVYLGLWKIGIQAAGKVFSWLYDHVVKPVWERGIKPVFKALGDFIKNDVAPKFKKGVDAIGKAWDGLVEAAKKPVRFVVNTVINDGIIGTFNKVAHQFNVPKIDTVKLPKGFADGGVLPGYSPGIDSIPAVLSPGEGILRPEVVRALGASTIDNWNSAAKAGRIAGFADGGIVGRAKGLVGDVGGFLTSPVKFLKHRVDSLIKQVGTGAFADLAKGLPYKVLDTIGGKLGNLFGKIGGAINVGGSSVQQWAPIVSAVLSMLGAPAGALGAVLTRIRIESGGNPNAINLTDSNARAGHPSQGLMQTIPGTFAAYAGPFRGRGITDPLASIYAGVNYAMHRYGSSWLGVMTRPGGYDNGGWLPPGMSMVENKTGKPEAILNPQQWAAVEKGMTGGGVTNITVQRTEDRHIARTIDRVQQRRDLAARTRNQFA